MEVENCCKFPEFLEITKIFLKFYNYLGVTCRSAQFALFVKYARSDVYFTEISQYT